MGTLAGYPLAGLSADSLYMLLGEAWIAQLRPKSGENYYLGTSLEAGKREFDAIVPQLRWDLNPPHPHGFIDCVGNTVRRCGTWAMPENIVAALADRLALAPTTHSQSLAAG